MRQNAPLCLFSDPAKSSESHPILGEFQIDHHQFLIISLKNDLDNNLSDILVHSSSHYTDCGRFEVQGHLCAIVRVEQPDHNIEGDLAALLTERELQIATLVASGRPNKQIASQLHISEWTVSTHLRRIFIKLGVDSRAAMVYRCASLIQRLCEQIKTT